MKHLDILHTIVLDLETAVAKLEHVIELLAKDDSGTIDLSALHRARDAARSSATITRNATSGVRRAFD